MGDITGPEEIEIAREKEFDETTVKRNLDLLRIKFIDKTPHEQLDEETTKALNAIGDGERIINSDKIETSIFLRYNTKTGQFQRPTKDFQLGEFSILRTHIVNDKDTNYIRLLQTGGMPMPHEHNATLTGEEDNLSEEGRKILPERIIPNEPLNIQGVFEPWGESKLVDNAHGDMVILKAIQKFNELYGHPK
ncbi:MAG: hypothetical protein AAB583_04705 [Patescibacteria group bacterium]